MSENFRKRGKTGEKAEEKGHHRYAERQKGCHGLLKEKGRGKYWGGMSRLVLESEGEEEKLWSKELGSNVKSRLVGQLVEDMRGSFRYGIRKGAVTVRIKSKGAPQRDSRLTALESSLTTQHSTSGHPRYIHTHSVLHMNHPVQRTV
ncbi:hypothetical protein CISG_03629 [Coccidioides immitis RMSCC 3703]|uniref:Uncharacterized protein n=1 Tax=Coccidioides immitis RMSCC 3703 TaxID=454286 RepID=A0A0J8QQ65_COCIT|nr:hypothetical protein CISG_03629 [Coccidioides immitis RMSCC 3703]